MMMPALLVSTPHETFLFPFFFNGLCIFYIFFLQGQGVIKPIACRPVVSSANTTPILGNRTLASSTSPPGSGSGGNDNHINNNNSSSSSSNVINNNNNSSSSSSGRNSWGLYSSTSDLRSSSQLVPQAGSNQRGLTHHLQRFSWSKSLVNDPPQLQMQQQQQQKIVAAAALPPLQPPPPGSLHHHHHHQMSGSVTSINSMSSSSTTSAAAATAAAAASGRVADLSRRFGGSLSSVAVAPNNS